MYICDLYFNVLGYGHKKSREIPAFSIGVDVDYFT